MDNRLKQDHLGIRLNQNQVNIKFNVGSTGGSSGTTDHSKLTNLDYEHSGHIGFASAAQIQELLDLLKDKQDTLIAGDNISIVDNIISATGLTKDEIYIGPDEPTDPNIKIWIDTNEVAEEFYTKEEIDAEYFEWKDGNPNNEDRVGYIVTLDGDKIVKADSGDDILGICSGTAMVLGDSAEWNWNKRYLTDDFGRIIYQDYDVEHEEVKDENTGKVIEEAWTEHIHAPKQNPAYDPSKAYTKRSERPEWQIVGMMGKLYVRDDGSCVVNGYADVKDGIATKASGKTNMRVMERVTDNIVRVLMK